MERADAADAAAVLLCVFYDERGAFVFSQTRQDDAAADYGWMDEKSESSNERRTFSGCAQFKLNFRNGFPLLSLRRLTLCGVWRSNFRSRVFFCWCRL